MNSRTGACGVTGATQPFSLIELAGLDSQVSTSICKDAREISTELGAGDENFVPVGPCALSGHRNGSCRSSLADDLSEAGTKHFSMKCFT